MEIVTGRMKRVDDSLRKPLRQQEREQLLARAGRRCKMV